jgi:hypothetical protein
MRGLELRIGGQSLGASFRALATDSKINVVSRTAFTAFQAIQLATDRNGTKTAEKTLHVSHEGSR